MGSTLLVARAQDQFSEGHTIYLLLGLRRADCSSHIAPMATHLPSIRHALLHQRYAISAAHVRLPLLALIHERRGMGILRSSHTRRSKKFAPLGDGQRIQHY